MTPLRQAISDELAALVAGMKAEVADPAKRAHLHAMALDAAMLQFRIAAGENVDEVVAALKAEALNMTLGERSAAIALAKTAVFNVLGSLMRAALGV